MKCFKTTKAQTRAVREFGNRLLTLLLTVSMMLQTSPLQYARATEVTDQEPAIEVVENEPQENPEGAAAAGESAVTEEEQDAVPEEEAAAEAEGEAASEEEAAPEADAEVVPEVTEANTEPEADPETAPVPEEEAEESVVPSKTEYVFVDNEENPSLRVTATLEDAAAISDDAILWVTPVTQESADYSYDAYMAALNATVEQDVYTSDNTLLYDVAFMVADEQTGAWTEVQPANGSVKVDFHFLSNQLSEGLMVEDMDDLQVVHMPVRDYAKADTTAHATGITADDISLEWIAADNCVHKGADEFEVKAQDFSVFALINQPAAEEQADAKAEPAEPVEAEGMSPEDGKDAGPQADAEASPTKTIYFGEHDDIRVVATLDDPAAIPDDAQLVVTPITETSEGYNYAAYMEALNQSGEGGRYTAQNTLLYDVAFITTDEAGVRMELQPSEGSVRLSFCFKGNQLTSVLGAEKTTDVHVIHLPLVEEVRESVATTEEAVAITANDVVVDVKNDALVTLGGSETSTFTTDSFSGVAFSVPDDVEPQGPHYTITLRFVDAEGNAVSAGTVGTYYVTAKMNGNSYFYSLIDDMSGQTYIEEFKDQNNNPVSYSEGAPVTVRIANSRWGTGVIDQPAWQIINDQGLNFFGVDSVIGHYIVKSVESAENNTTITLQEKPGYKVTVNLFDFDKVTPYAEGIQKGEYVIRVKATGSDGKVYYAVEPITLKDVSSNTVLVEDFVEFTSEDDTTQKFSNSDTSTASNKVPFDPATMTVERNDVRLIHNKVKVDHGSWFSDEYITCDAYAFSADDSIDGFIFMSNTKSGNSSTIALRRCDFKYGVRIFFEPEGIDIVDGDYAYLRIEVYHQTTADDYFAQQILIDKDDLEVDADGNHYTDIMIPHWMDNNGNITSDEFTGNEREIIVRLVKAQSARTEKQIIDKAQCTTLEESDYLKNYVVSYGSRIRIEDTDNKARDYFDTIYLTKDSATSDYNFKSILGPGVSYGITADRFMPVGSDVQSNFATNYYNGERNVANPNLAGNAGAIAVAEYVRFTDDRGQTYTIDPNGKIWIGDSYHDPDRGPLPVVLYTDSADRLSSSQAPVHIVEMPSDEITNTIVEPIIAYMKDMSEQMAAHEPNVSIVVTDQNGYIDATGYDDGATIYVDGDSIPQSVLQKTEGLVIKKREHQTIVFNFTKTEELTLAKYHVDILHEDGTVEPGSSEPSKVHGTDTNTFLDRITKTIVWNLASVKDATFQSTAGIILIPNPDSYAVTIGTSTGWLITDGYFTTGSGEWHYVYADLSDVDTAHIHAYKRVNNTEASQDQKFEFKFEQYVGSADTGYEFQQMELIENNGSVVEVEVEPREGAETFGLTEGWNIFRITETRIVSAEGVFEPNEQVFYAAVQYKNVGTPSSPQFITGATRYFGTFDETKFNKEALSPAETGLDGEVGRATFVNKSKAGNISFEKSIAGFDPEEAGEWPEFNFEVVINAPTNEGEIVPLTGIFKAKVYRKDKPEEVETKSIQFKNGKTSFTLPVGYIMTILDIPTGADVKSDYTFSEERTAGYYSESINNPGQVTDGETTEVQFINHRTGELSVEKTVISKDPADLKRPFEFTVTLFNTEGEVDETVNGKFGDMTFVNGVATFELTHGDIASAEGLPSGDTYTVVETPVEGFEITKDGDEGTIVSGETREAVFVNSTSNEGTLSVKKQVVSPDASDKTKEFAFKITLGKINGEYGDATFTDNVATVTTEKGKTKTIAGLPDYIKYDISSDPVVTGTYGDLTYDENGKATFVSTDGTIRLSDDLPAGVTFTITLSFTGTYGDIEFTDGVAEFTLHDGVTKTAEHLPLGLTYTVEETDAATGFTVTHDGVAGKTAEGSIAVASAHTFKNEKATTIQLQAAKAVKGHDWPKDASVTFTVGRHAGEGDPNAPLPSPTTTDPLTAPGTATFADITLGAADKGKTYYYEITENATGFGDGWTGSPNKVIAKVEVGQGDASGVLHPTVTYSIDGGKTYGTEAKFYTITNTYKTEGTEVILKATKSLIGREWADGDSFDFKIEATGAGASTAPMPAQDTVHATKQEQTISWGAMAFDEPGTWTYKVTEPAGTAGGVTYDQSEYEVEVSVADGEQGDLVATVKVNGKPVSATGDPAAFQVGTFENTYEAKGSTTVGGTKVLENRDFKETDDWTFTIRPVGDAPLRNQEGGETVTELTTDNDGSSTFTFGTLYYQLSDLAGVKPDKDGVRTKDFQYTITESGDYSSIGITNDADNPKTITISVTDSGTGTLAVTQFPDGSAATFTNTYEAKGEIVIHGVKSIDVGTQTDLSGFEFTLSGNGVRETVTTDADGKFSFTALKYEVGKGGVKADSTTTFSYTISESERDGYVKMGDITLEVTVTDNATGKLDVTSSMPKAGYEIVNKHEATGSVTFEGTKSIDKRDLTEGDVFTFEILENGEVIATAQNDATGKINYPSINYELNAAKGDADLGVHTYTVREALVDSAGIKSDTRTYEVKVNVIDNGTSKLTVNPTEEFSILDFVNTYEASGELVLSGKKAITNKPASMDLSGFKFTVKEGGEDIATGTSAADGTIAFDAIAYPDLSCVGVHTYVVSEDADSKPGVTNTTSTVTVKVNVADDGKGNLVATATEDSPAAIDAVNFTNTYDAKGQAILSVKKAANAKLGEKTFQFELLDESGKVLQTSAGVKQGDTVAFDAIAYTLADLKGAASKTFTYQIREVLPAGATVENKYTVDNITYDTHVETVKVTVVDAGDGTLAVTYNGAPTFATAEFSNNTTDETSVSVKKLWVRGGKAVAWPAGAKVTVALMADGTKVAEHTLTADAPSFTFTGLAKIGADGGEITYKVAEVHVSGVSDKYNTTVAGNATDGFQIKNAFVTMPQTGDIFSPTTVGILVGAGVLTLIGGIILKRRKDD